MGNRAIIRQGRNKHTGVYLHWNGGRDSVEAFLKYCKLKGFSGFDTDYGLARFCQVVGNFFGGSDSIGILDDIWDSSAKGVDNGIYIVRGWEIVDRILPTGVPEQRNHDQLEMLLAIDEAQPLKEQFGAQFFTAPIVPVSDLKVGDKVLVRDSLRGVYEEWEIVGFGEDRFVNGHKALGVPYVNRFLNDGTYANNVNNYLFDETYRISTN